MGQLKRVLVVDDDTPTREAVEAILDDEGYEVRTAQHGQEALERLASWTPDAILLDMRMPVMDGWAFAEQYRRTSGPHAPILVLTAAADASRSAREIGATGTVPKPFSIGDLLAALERLAAAAESS
jgi:CheY-like chemotaxis protein